jgi:hypothetical protein
MLCRVKTPSTQVIVVDKALQNDQSNRNERSSFTSCPTTAHLGNIWQSIWRPQSIRQDSTFIFSLLRRISCFEYCLTRLYYRGTLHNASTVRNIRAEKAKRRRADVEDGVGRNVRKKVNTPDNDNEVVAAAPTPLVVPPLPPAAQDLNAFDGDDDADDA